MKHGKNDFQKYSLRSPQDGNLFLLKIHTYPFESQKLWRFLFQFLKVRELQNILNICSYNLKIAMSFDNL